MCVGKACTVNSRILPEDGAAVALRRGVTQRENEPASLSVSRTIAVLHQAPTARRAEAALVWPRPGPQISHQRHRIRIIPTLSMINNNNPHERCRSGRNYSTILYLTVRDVISFSQAHCYRLRYYRFCLETFSCLTVAFDTANSRC